jgi:hypothetical protein
LRAQIRSYFASVGRPHLRALQGSHSDSVRRTIVPAAVQYCLWYTSVNSDDAAKEPMSEVWKTKYGTRRVRRDPPTLQEAIAAARGLTDDVHAQVEIAASLMELPVEQVRAELLKSGGQRKDIKTIGVTAGRPGALRTVVVERKISRRPAALRTMK